MDLKKRERGFSAILHPTTCRKSFGQFLILADSPARSGITRVNNGKKSICKSPLTSNDPTNDRRLELMMGRFQLEFSPRR